MKTAASLFLATLGLVLVGCGGGGTKEIVPGEVVSPGIIPPTASLRSQQIGDTWTYDVSGRVTKPSSSQPFTGTMIRTVTQEPFADAIVMKITERLLYTPQGGVPISEVEEYYVRQDPDRSIHLLGRKGQGYVLRTESSTYELPGTWDVGTAYSGTTTLRVDSQSQGLNVTQTDSQTLNVTNHDDVRIVIGDYGTWRTQYSRNAISMFSIAAPVSGDVLRIDEDEAATEWWNPQMGSFIRKESNKTVRKTVASSNGAPVEQTTTWTITYVLKETSAR